MAFFTIDFSTDYVYRDCQETWLSGFSLISKKDLPAILLDQKISEPFHFFCGLPQRSLISPIIFLLCVETFPRLSRGRLGYTDNFCLLATARALKDCGYIKRKSKLNQNLPWERENGVIFDGAKKEFQYFYNKRKYTESSLNTGACNVNPKEQIHWLGVIFVSKLNFKDQARRACQ